jgi:hypothetical protein
VPARSVAEIQRLAEHDHVAELRELEDSTKASALGSLPADLDRLQRAVVRGWVAAFGGLDQPGDGEALARLLTVLRVRLRSTYQGRATTASAAILAALEDALALGLEQQRQLTGLKPELDPELPTEIRTNVAQVGANLREQLREADRLLRATGAGARFSQILAALAKARGAVNRIELAADHAVETARSSAAEQFAEHHDVPRLWIAERDSCLTCLAYAGRTAAVGKAFPSGLSFGKASTAAEPRNAPPAHPRCRCSIMAWTGGNDLPEALKREARRSVLKGWSLESESQASRLDAAERLLQRGARLPGTVEREARQAVRARRFRSRSVPTSR